MAVWRYVGAVLISILVGSLVIGGLQLVGILLFPLPVSMERFNAMTWDEKSELMHAAPPLAFAFVLIGYAVGTFAAGAVVTVLWPLRKLTGAMIIGAFYILMNAANVAMLPQPLWVTISSFVLFLPCALLGGWLVRPKPPTVAMGNGATNP